MRTKTMLADTCVAGLFLFSASGHIWTQSAQHPAGSAPLRTAEQVYKNIQVLKEVPADQIIPAMQFITASLGVQCDFCHQENAFEKDEKETKQTARKMMRMMFAINKDNFENNRKVTCYACHRGEHKPVITPIIGSEDSKFAAAETVVTTERSDAGLPSAEQILEKYLQAVGGAEAAAKILTRVQKGTITVGSQHFPVEVLAKAPSKRVTTVHFPGGDSITGVNGDEGWLSAQGHAVHDMSFAEADAARMDAKLFFPTLLRQLFKELRVQQQEPVNGHQTYVFLGISDGKPPVQLYFDRESGLLVRVLRFTETPLGQNPTQIDYADYRDEDGVKTPFAWTIARPNGRFTIQMQQAEQNVPIEDNKFEKPGSGTNHAQND